MEKLIFFCFLVSTISLAEPGEAPIPSSRDLRKQKKLEAIDSEFFDPQKEIVQPTTTESPVSGQRRFFDQTAEIRNSETEAKGNEKCKGDKDNPPKFRQCMKEFRADAERELEKKFRKVEERVINPEGKNAAGDGENVDELLRVPAEEEWEKE